MATSHVLPTGIDFLDEALSGGHFPGVFGLLGPIGVGKTTLGAMIATEGALREHAGFEKGRNPRCWVFVTLEMAGRDIWPMTRSYATKIPRTELRHLRLYVHRRCGRNPISRDLEQKYASQLRTLEEVEKSLSVHLEIIDLALNVFSLASEPVEQILELIAATLGGRQIAGIVIDYVGLLLSRFIDSHGLDVRSMSRLIKASVKACREISRRN